MPSPLQLTRLGCATLCRHGRSGGVYIPRRSYPSSIPSGARVRNSRQQPRVPPCAIPGARVRDRSPPWYWDLWGTITCWPRKGTGQCPQQVLVGTCTFRSRVDQPRSFVQRWRQCTFRSSGDQPRSFVQHWRQCTFRSSGDHRIPFVAVCPLWQYAQYVLVAVHATFGAACAVCVLRWVCNPT